MPEESTALDNNVAASRNNIQSSEAFVIDANISYSSTDVCNHSEGKTRQPFKIQYELGNEVDRSQFLNSFQHFCTVQGHPCTVVPYADNVNNVSFDLYLMYKTVAEKGGYLALEHTEMVSGNQYSTKLNIHYSAKVKSFCAK